MIPVSFREEQKWPHPPISPFPLCSHTECGRPTFRRKEETRHSVVTCMERDGDRAAQPLYPLIFTDSCLFLTTVLLSVSFVCLSVFTHTNPFPGDQMNVCRVYASLVLRIQQSFPLNSTNTGTVAHLQSFWLNRSGMPEYMYFWKATTKCWCADYRQPLGWHW